MNWEYNDGGRAAAGYKGAANDCVVRAIAIATEQAYQTVYDALNNRAIDECPRKGRQRSDSRTGVWRRTYQTYLESLGWVWTPTMAIGQGCTVHLRSTELPSGRLVVAVSKHLTAMVDGVGYDTVDPSRSGTRCVYGYYFRCDQQG